MSSSAMSQRVFVARHEKKWAEFERLLGREWLAQVVGTPVRDPQAPQAPEESRVDPIRELELYKEICTHLALAQSRGYSSALRERLNSLATRGHSRLYIQPRRSWRDALHWVLKEYPLVVSRNASFLLVSCALFFLPMIVFGICVYAEPNLVYSVMDESSVNRIESMYNPENELRYGYAGRDSQGDVAAFAFYIRHNTTIGFQTFVGGLLFGIGTCFYLLFNAFFLGAVVGYLTAIGSGTPLWSFIAGHSAFELTAIALSGAAGCRLAWSLIAPGRRSRRAALKEDGREAVRIMFGAMVLFVLAAFVEAFWSSMIWIPPLLKYVVGASLWALLGVYMLLGVRRIDA